MRRGLALALAASILATACGGDDTQGDDGADCADLRGTWDLGGTCGADVCAIAQAGCGITEVDCASGAFSTSGDIDGNSFSYTGVSGAGVPATCSGTYAGGTISGSCTSEVATCSFSGERE